MNDPFSREYARSARLNAESTDPSDFNKLLDVAHVQVSARKDRERRVNSLIAGLAMFAGFVILAVNGKPFWAGLVWFFAVCFFGSAVNTNRDKA